MDPRTGAVLWRANKAAFPLMARGHRLLALLPQVPGTQGWRLGVLDVRSGVILSRFPIWGGGGGAVGDGLGSSTGMEAFSVQGRDYVVWRSRRTHVSGAYMPQRQPEPVYRDSGMAEVDLFRGTLIPVSEEMPDRSLKIQVNPEGGYHTEPFDVDGVTAVASTDHVSGKVQLVLRRTRDAAALPDVVLCEPPGGSVGVQVSADRRYVAGSCPDPATVPRYHYGVVVHSTVTGERVGRLVSAAWPAAFVVWNGLLLYFFPDSVHVGSFSAGKELFAWPVKDLRYHGPYPP